MPPDLLVTNPTVGYTENQTGGFLDPMIGTLLVAVLAMAIAAPVGDRDRRLAERVRAAGRAGAGGRVDDRDVRGRAVDRARAVRDAALREPGRSASSARRTAASCYGRSFFAAGAMLSLVALPLVVASGARGAAGDPGPRARGLLRGRQDQDRDHPARLLPAARPSVITGSMLGVGRVIGDTAIIVVLLGATLNLQGVGSTPLLGHAARDRQHADQLHLRQRADRATATSRTRPTPPRSCC